jgi:pyridoxal/pyridoxine/pyridoxamine kinase
MDELYKLYKSNANINEFLDSINEGLLASFDKVYSGFINEYDQVTATLQLILPLPFLLKKMKNA